MNNNNQMLVAETISKFCRLILNSKADLPIRSSEMGLLIMISQSPTPITSIDAASFFNVSKPMIAGMVRSLVKKDYIYKDPSKTDKRSYNLMITESGQQLVDEAINDYTRVVRQLESNLGEKDFLLLTDLLAKANIILGGKQWEK